jgi:hypothetical protein
MNSNSSHCVAGQLCQTAGVIINQAAKALELEDIEARLTDVTERYPANGPPQKCD